MHSSGGADKVGILQNTLYHQGKAQGNDCQIVAPGFKGRDGDQQSNTHGHQTAGQKCQREHPRHSKEIFTGKCRGIGSDGHKTGTGVGNERILENFTRLADRGANIFVRYPYIPGMNDDQAEKIAGFLSRWQQIEAELLPYHKLGNSKYRALEAQNMFEGTVPLKDEVEMLKKKYGFQ